MTAQPASGGQRAGMAEWETVWGVMFPPPHVNAFEVAHMPDEIAARWLVHEGACVLVTAQRSPWQIWTDLTAVAQGLGWDEGAEVGT